MRKTASFIGISDLFDAFGIDEMDRDTILVGGFDGVTWGDAGHTLIGNNFAYNCLMDGLHYLMQNEPVEKYHAVWEVVHEKFWEIVGESDYIDMEN